MHLQPWLQKWWVIIYESYQILASEFISFLSHCSFTSLQLTSYELCWCSWMLFCIAINCLFPSSVADVVLEQLWRHLAASQDLTGWRKLARFLSKLPKGGSEEQMWCWRASRKRVKQSTLNQVAWTAGRICSSKLWWSRIKMASRSFSYGQSILDFVIRTKILKIMKISLRRVHVHHWTWIHKTKHGSNLLLKSHLLLTNFFHSFLKA